MRFHHVRAHRLYCRPHPDKPWACTLCGEAFSDSEFMFETMSLCAVGKNISVVPSTQN